MQSERWNGFSDEEMDVVRNTDLTELLEYLGYQVFPIGSYYSTKEMESIRIKKVDPRYFRRYSTQENGDSITFLQLYENKSFVEAVKFLLAYHGYSKDKTNQPFKKKQKPKKEEPKPEFVLPKSNKSCRHVFAYLSKRGISWKIIKDYIEKGLLYEETKYYNCVFTGKDSEGKTVFAYKRGTYDKKGGGFKSDVTGSDKSVAFRLPAKPKLEQVFVFESPIDLMSHTTLYGYPTTNAVAQCGLWDGPLETYLKENPHIRDIVLCLDNDAPGRNAIQQMRKKYEGKGYSIKERLPKAGKDWNEMLQKHMRKKQMAR